MIGGGSVVQPLHAAGSLEQEAVDALAGPMGQGGASLDPGPVPGFLPGVMAVLFGQVRGFGAGRGGRGEVG